MLTLLRRWLPFALLATILCALPFVMTQQVLRHGADELPLRIAEEAALQLEGGVGPATIIGTRAVDASQSMAPFLMIFSESGSIIASSVVLDNQSFLPPAGVLEAARASGESRITWAPRADLRLAIVVQTFGGERPGFVLAGQSLRETEATIATLQILTLIAWGASLLLLLLTVALWPRRS